jgi:hypothetical protein
MLTMTLEQWKLTKHQAKHGVPVPDRATAEWQGKRYEQIDAHGAIFALARQLVADGCPDQPWQALGTNGMCCLHGPSLHGLTKWTIQESSSQPIRRVPYVPLPEGAFRRSGSSKDGAEASGRGGGCRPRPCGLLARASGEGLHPTLHAAHRRGPRHGLKVVWKGRRCG